MRKALSFKTSAGKLAASSIDSEQGLVAFVILPDKGIIPHKPPSESSTAQKPSGVLMTCLDITKRGCPIAYGSTRAKTFRRVFKAPWGELGVILDKAPRHHTRTVPLDRKWNVRKRGP